MLGCGVVIEEEAIAETAPGFRVLGSGFTGTPLHAAASSGHLESCLPYKVGLWMLTSGLQLGYCPHSVTVGRYVHIYIYVYSTVMCKP